MAIQEGDRFNRLTVFELLGYRLNSRNRRVRMWRCLCDCGASVVAYDLHLKSGNTKSCGCLRREKAANNGTRTHQMTGSRTYASWRAMLNRCNHLSHTHFDSYGGRGVTVCDRWDPAKGGSFENFYADMGERPEGKTLDKDIRGDGLLYSPEACCWATPKEQAQHRRNTAYGLVGGALLRVDQVAELAGISTAAAGHRIHRGFTGAQLLAPASRNGIAARKSTLNRQLELV